MKSKNFFTTTLLQYFSEASISMPWRGYNPDPYAVLISETMLQQTQVSRVIEKFTEFTEVFPTIFDVATATNEQILKLWNGLGYNSRAVRLKKTCEEIVSNWNGTIPNNYEQLRNLPGIGDYTASAILCFAYRVPTIVVDVNVVRVISRFFSQLSFTTDQISDKEVRQQVKILLPKNKSSEFFQAIMDVARLYCKKSKPLCDSCPLTKKCLSSNKLQFQTVKKRSEPSYLGLPRRIWRGKIVKILTLQSPISFEELVTTLQMQEHSDWIKSIVLLLQNDSIVEYDENSSLINIRL